MARTVSIRTGLLTSLLLVIVLLAGGIMAITFAGARRAVETLSKQIISRQLGEIDAHLEAFFDPAQRGLREAADWGRAGLLDAENPEALRKLLQPIMRRNPQITSMMVADERSREFMLLRVGDKWRNRITKNDVSPGRVRWIEWTDDDPQPKEREADLKYDPTVRPWFRQAIENREQVMWTDPYTFFTTKEPGITASVALSTPEGRWIVVGFDILLNDISAATMEMGDETQVFILTDQRKVIGLPAWFRTSSPKEQQSLLLQDPARLQLRMFDDALNEEDRAEPVRFLSEGMPWWKDQQPFHLGPGRSLDITVLVKEETLLASIAEIRTNILIVTGGVLVAVILLAFAVAGRFGGPIKDLVHQTDRISHGDLDEGETVKTRVRELHQLAHAQERMRVSLRKLLKLEGDLRIAQQIQKDTWPETLPKLAGFELFGWSQPADETGGDTYDIVGMKDGALTNGEADRAVLLLADATGHGIGPALSAMQARAMLRMALRTGHDISEIALQMNVQLNEDLEAARFVTAWFGNLDARTGQLQTFSAGQGPLLYYEAAKDEWHSPHPEAPPLGVLGKIKVEMSDPITMKPGDLYAVLSDGFYEAANPSSELFGEDRVTETLGQHRTKTPKEMLAALREAVDTFTEGAPPDDDRTAVIIKRI